MKTCQTSLSRFGQPSTTSSPDGLFVTHTHRPYFDRGNFDLEVVNEDIFSGGEVLLLRRFGFWMEALAKGVIQPETDAQQAFVQVCRGEREPETTYELLWQKLKLRREFEREGLVGSGKSDDNRRRAIENSINLRDDWWSSSERE
ncbi:MAG: hypothetical protein FJ381_05935 [Verrucomicrobia bacterium]|nr:hypothetical protein [Verrucomicrobiota bacterium]